MNGDRKTKERERRKKDQFSAYESGFLRETERERKERLDSKLMLKEKSTFYLSFCPLSFSYEFSKATPKNFSFLPASPVRKKASSFDQTFQPPSSL